MPRKRNTSPSAFYDSACQEHIKLQHHHGENAVSQPVHLNTPKVAVTMPFKVETHGRLGTAVARCSLTVNLACSAPRRELEPKLPPKIAVRERVERVDGTQRCKGSDVRSSYSHYFDTRRSKTQHQMCDSTAKARLAQVYIQPDQDAPAVDLRGGVSVGAPLINQPQKRRVDASHRCASTTAV